MNSIFQTFFKDLITCTNIYIFYFYKYSYLFSAFEGTLSSSNKILYSHFYFLFFNLKFWSYISSIIILKWGERKEKLFFLYLNDFIIFKAKASISKERRAVKGRAKFKSSTMIVLFRTGATTSTSTFSSFSLDLLFASISLVFT